MAPAQYAAHEASASSDTPWGGHGRYQQLHGDLRGTARTFTGLAWRRDGTANTNAAMIARNPDVEIVMAHTSLSAISATFASNVGSGATTVFTRRSVSGPDLRSQPLGLPAPWSFPISLDVPFPYTGASDLLYDLKIHTNTSGNLYPFDAASGRDGSMFGGYTSVGTGCSTAHGFMNLRSTFLTNAGTNQLTLQWAVEGGPTNQVAAILVGLTNPNFFSTLLCAGYPLYTDAAVMVVPATSDALGRFTSPTLTIPWRASYAGAALTAQAGALEILQPSGVAASNGIRSTVAPAPVALQMSRVIAPSAPTALTGTVYVGYGLVTRFQY